MDKKALIWIMILAIISFILGSLLLFALGIMIIYIRGKDSEDWITKKTVILFILIIFIFGLEIIIGIGFLLNEGII